jgi:hypothetical protein
MIEKQISDTSLNLTCQHTIVFKSLSSVNRINLKSNREAGLFSIQISLKFSCKTNKLNSYLKKIWLREFHLWIYQMKINIELTVAHKGCQVIKLKRPSLSITK